MEARKAQAASRWSDQESSQPMEEEVIFTPIPIRQTSPPHQSITSPTLPVQPNLPSTDRRQTADQNLPSRNELGSRSPSSHLSSTQVTPPALPSTERSQNSNCGSLPHNKRRTNSTLSNQSLTKLTSLPPSTDKTPARSSKSKSATAPRRGLHFQSAAAKSSDDEIGEEAEDNPEESIVISDGSSDSKEQRLEIQALRKRLEKVHKRLNIACKFFQT